VTHCHVDIHLLLYHVFRGSNFSYFINFLAEVKQGQVGGVKIHLNRLQVLISTSCIEHLEFARDGSMDKELHHKLRYVALGGVRQEQQQELHYKLRGVSLGIEHLEFSRDSSMSCTTS
jgi:hypothetical protein